MKTLKQVQTELNETMKKLQDLKYAVDPKDKKEFSRLKKRLPLLKSTILYLKTEPTDEYCKLTKAELERKIGIHESRYVLPVSKDRMSKPQLNKHRKSYEKEVGIAKMKAQLIPINYILL